MNYTADPGLLLYLPLSRMDGNKLSSKDPYGHICTNYGSEWNWEGRAFNGVDQSIRIASSPVFSTEKGSLEFWFKPAEQTGYRALVTYAGNANNKLEICFKDRNIEEISLRVAGEDWPYSWRMPMPADSSPPGSWHHLVVTQDGIAAKAYLNGQHIKTASKGNNLGSWTSELLDSCYWRIAEPTWQGFFTGLVNGVRIYNFPLTTTEIQNRYVTGKCAYR